MKYFVYERNPGENCRMVAFAEQMGGAVDLADDEASIVKGWGVLAEPERDLGFPGGREEVSEVGHRGVGRSDWSRLDILIDSGSSVIFTAWLSPSTWTQAGPQ
jgi:hypothetical protein